MNLPEATVVKIETSPPFVGAVVRHELERARVQQRGGIGAGSPPPRLPWQGYRRPAHCRHRGLRHPKQWLDVFRSHPARLPHHSEV